MVWNGFVFNITNVIQIQKWDRQNPQKHTYTVCNSVHTHTHSVQWVCNDHFNYRNPNLSVTPGNTGYLYATSLVTIATDSLRSDRWTDHWSDWLSLTVNQVEWGLIGEWKGNWPMRRKDNEAQELKEPFTKVIDWVCVSVCVSVYVCMCVIILVRKR